VASRQVPSERVEAIQREDALRVPIGWLRAYMVQLVVNVVLAVRWIIEDWSWGDRLMEAAVLGWGALSALVAIGLFERRLWGWKANWIHLGVGTVAVALELAYRWHWEPGFPWKAFLANLALFVPAWLVTNAIYFRKRRHLFN
jgi:hypothetical protein